jgi:hypothetical protein
MRKEALAGHRVTQAGLRARTELIQKHKQKKDRDLKSSAALVKERSDILNALVTMEFLLGLELDRERELHWILLHERLDSCAQGYVEVCNDLFASQFYNDRELLDEGIPGIYLNPKKRFVHEYSVSEQASLLRNSGKERVLQSICTKKDLLPDADSRIYTRVGDYLQYMERDAGIRQKMRVVSPAEMNSSATKYSSSLSEGILFRKERTLFGRFLETGEKGYRRALMCIVEYIGLLFSPLSLTWQLVWFIGEEIGNRMWKNLKVLAAVEPSHASVWTTRASQLAQWMVAVEDESSWQYSFYYNSLDWTSNSAYLAYRDRFSVILSPLMWIYDVLSYTPMMYLRAYLTNARARLPPSRHACLLRDGIRSAKQELSLLSKSIRQNEEIQRLLLESEREGAGKDVNKFQSMPHIHFGIDGSWETLLGACVSRVFPNSASDNTLSGVDGYNYTLCLFDELLQGDIRLGRFSHWGEVDISLTDNSWLWNSWSHDSVEELSLPQAILRKHLMSIERQKELYRNTDRSFINELNTLMRSFESFPSLIQGFLSLTADSLWAGVKSIIPSEIVDVFQFHFLSTTAMSLEWLHPSNLTRALNALSSAEKESILRESVQNYFSTQVYDQGTMCAVRPGFYRRAIVHFECASNFAIQDVTEIEV